MFWGTEFPDREIVSFRSCVGAGEAKLRGRAREMIPPLLERNQDKCSPWPVFCGCPPVSRRVSQGVARVSRCPGGPPTSLSSEGWSYRYDKGVILLECQNMIIDTKEERKSSIPTRDTTNILYILFAITKSTWMTCNRETSCSKKGKRELPLPTERTAANPRRFLGQMKNVTFLTTEHQFYDSSDTVIPCGTPTKFKKKQRHAIARQDTSEHGDTAYPVSERIRVWEHVRLENCIAVDNRLLEQSTGQWSR